MSVTALVVVIYLAVAVAYISHKTHTTSRGRPEIVLTGLFWLPLLVVNLLVDEVTWMEEPGSDECWDESKEAKR